MADIYELHEKAFANVSAFVICKAGERVATIALKFPKDGAGRLYAYVHWIGVPMVRGLASGYGYDKRTAAIVNAVRKMTVNPSKDPTGADMDLHVAFMRALESDGGEYWDTHLRNAGFDVFQAV